MAQRLSRNFPLYWRSNKRWLSSTNSTSSSPPPPPLCPVLAGSLPNLEERFRKLSDKNGGTFPVLHRSINEKLLQRWNPDDHTKRASVLIALYSDHGVPSILFTARSPEVPLNPSEISFPGGHAASSEESLEDTALREAQEELMGDYPWKDPDHLTILGQGTTIPAITGTPVTPMIAVMTQEIRQPLQEMFPGDKGEVDVVFGMPIQELLKTEGSHELPDHRLLGKERMGPRFPSPHGYIWGLTAFMLRPLLHKLYRPIFNLKNK